MNRNFNLNSTSVNELDLNRKVANLNGKKNLPSIEEEINRIFKLLSANVSESETVVREKPGKWSSSCGSISIYNIRDLQREDKSRKATPVLRFVFYPGTLFTSQLGSVSIYGADVLTKWGSLRGYLFGHSIREVNIEMGRRLFVDVKLAA